MTIFKCACGKSHAKFARTQIVDINGNKWSLDCFLDKMGKEYHKAQAEAMLSQLILSEVKATYPDIDIDSIASKISKELNETFSKENTK